MPVQVLRLEGVNFSATLDDTNDLSVHRGASLALLWAAERAQILLETHCTAKTTIKRLYAGASQAAFRFDADAGEAERLRAALEQALRSEGEDPNQLDTHTRDIAGDDGDAKGWENCLPLAHLCCVVDVAEAKDGSDAAVGAALAAAEARNRQRQLRSLTLRLPTTTNADKPDQKWRMLPADFDVYLPPGSVTPIPDDDKKAKEPQDDTGKTKVARSVAARRHFGRRMRQFFYRREVHALESFDPALDQTLKNLRFTDSIEDICAEPPADVPEAIANKLAVFYADGNKFGTLRRKLGATGTGPLSPAALESFSERLQSYRRNDLLRPLLDWLLGQLEATDDAVRRRVEYRNPARPDRRALRFETLEWGGDELTWVAPAWLAFELAALFFAQTKDWVVGEQGHPLTHAVGLVICDRKTPIRQSVAMAKDLAEQVKTALKTDQHPTGTGNALQVEVFESADLPDGQLIGHRCRLYPGLQAAYPNADENAQPLAAAFSLPGTGVRPLIDHLAKLKDPGGTMGLPRSQLYKLLQVAVRRQGFAGGAGDKAVDEALDRYRRHAGKDQDVCSDKLDLWAVAGVGSNDPLAQTRTLSLKLALTAQLWDYVAPFAATDPPGAQTDRKTTT